MVARRIDPKSAGAPRCPPWRAEVEDLTSPDELSMTFPVADRDARCAARGGLDGRGDLSADLSVSRPRGTT